MSQTRGSERALVLGASMAGLLAARVLADRYDRVTVVDRDELRGDGAPRRGVPQGRHVHVLLPRGQEAIEKLFPGLNEELIAAGAPYFDPLRDARLSFSGHWLERGPAGLRMATMSRPFFEDLVRDRVASLPNVSFEPSCKIVGLATASDGGRVIGARVVRRGAGEGATVLDADLVVDATGRGSRTPRYLEELGYAAPAEEKVVIKVGYATAVYRLPADVLGGDWGILLAPYPERPRGAAFWRLEGDRWMLTQFGVSGDYPPTDLDGFVRFARSLPVPELGEAIAKTEPLAAPVPHRFPANVRRRYERLSRFPAGFVVLGDSVCSFNPIYGQGMSVAALEALALREHLRRNAEAAPLRFFRALAPIVDVPWELAIGGDLAFPEAEGRRTRKLQVVGAYVDRLHAAAAHDVRLGTAFLRVAGLVDRPEALLWPTLALRVLRGALRRSANHGGGAV